MIENNHLCIEWVEYNTSAEYLDVWEEKTEAHIPFVFTYWEPTAIFEKFVSFWSFSLFLYFFISFFIHLLLLLLLLLLFVLLFLSDYFSIANLLSILSLIFFFALQSFRYKFIDAPNAYDYKLDRISLPRWSPDCQARFNMGYDCDFQPSVIGKYMRNREGLEPELAFFYEQFTLSNGDQEGMLAYLNYEGL